MGNPPGKEESTFYYGCNEKVQVEETVAGSPILLHSEVPGRGGGGKKSYDTDGTSAKTRGAWPPFGRGGKRQINT